MGAEFVPTHKSPKLWPLVMRLALKSYQLHMLLFGHGACMLKTLDMESSFLIYDCCPGPSRAGPGLRVGHKRDLPVLESLMDFILFPGIAVSYALL